MGRDKGRHSDLLFEAAMQSVVEEIPRDLQPAVEAALDWLHRERGSAFQLTGLVGADAALEKGADEARELGLVLCDGDVCLREQVRVQPEGAGFRVTEVEAGDSGIPPQLDPPPGLRKEWLDRQLANYSFVVLLFYRGFW